MCWAWGICKQNRQFLPPGAGILVGETGLDAGDSVVNKALACGAFLLVRETDPNDDSCCRGGHDREEAWPGGASGEGDEKGSDLR